MRRSTLSLVSLLTSLFLVACSDDADPKASTSSQGNGGTGGTGGGGGAGGEPGAGGGGGTGGESVAGKPIDAPAEQWTWVPFEDAFCANGTTTGIGVNLTDKSSRVLVYLEGGGACWSELTCYTLGTAANFASGYGEQSFTADIGQITSDPGGFFDRNAADNPFKDYNYVFVPYCTGDTHVGDNVVKYGDKTAMHVGFKNMDAYLKRLVPTFPSAERVFLAGSSAGGFGAAFNWWRSQEAFGPIRVDLIDDSGMPIPPTPGVQGFQAVQIEQWNTVANLPPDCTECADGQLHQMVGFYGRTFPDHRGAFLSYTKDTVLSQFNGITTAQFEEGLNAETETQMDPYPSLHYFIFEKSSHVLWSDPLLTTNDVTLQQWLTQMVTDDPSWTSQHP